MSSRRMTINGPLLQAKVCQFAQDLGYTEFKGSNGWLQNFLKRHNIVFKSVCGESVM